MPATLVAYGSLRSLATLPWQFIVRVYRGGLNTRNIPTLVFNFALNFFPVFIWLCVFKNAGLIPTSWRPLIHSKLAFLADAFMFGDSAGELHAQYGDSASEILRPLSWVSAALFAVLVCTVLPVSLWYYLYYCRRCQTNVLEPYAHLFHRDYRFSPTNRRVLLPFLLLLLTFSGLNCVNLLAWQRESNFTKYKDILAWVSYVLLHLIAPILTAVYLYVFQPPGTLKAFSLAMGAQNICGVFTHLLVPMAPPWFIHMYGVHDTEHVSYDQPGYAAGLTRVDSHLGTHLNSKGFHKSPIVFGAVPSLHSAMAVQCFLFLITRAAGTKARPCIIDSPITGSSFTSETESADKNPETDPNTIELQSLPDSSPDTSPDASLLVNAINPVRASNPSFQYGTPVPMGALNSKLMSIFHMALIPRCLGTAFPILQWWSTMYLDHHFRFDLFIGMWYAVTSHLLVNAYYLQPRVLKRWCDLRMGITEDTRKEAKTMGMRVFEDTNVEWFFDPFA
ncbi:LAME_0C06062g1_1 [Lachancea meyersii CBS 8951]|uniref:LAME_0C06062g1_1 n=1 Tax=Lachancea meyersii CBS 8951 TaxID=1266667 RepID=A0A1G4J231_9SACH|nr:LAME_0C06062g1_1 [Lachancea meyersii CBS 8951]